MAGTEGTPVGTPRRGARRAAKPKRTLQPKLVALGLGAVAALVAWGLLVWVGRRLRPIRARRRLGQVGATWPRPRVGAVVCLFLCLWLCTVLLRRVGILEDNRPQVQTHRH